MTTQQLDMIGAASPPATDVTVRGFDALTAVARRKLNAPAAWEWHTFKRIGDSNDVLLTGGVPSYPHLKSARRWQGVKDQQVVVTEAEAHAACAEYELATGICHVCGGSAREWAGWSRDRGHRFRDCTRCGATGQAPTSTTVEVTP